MWKFTITFFVHSLKKIQQNQTVFQKLFDRVIHFKPTNLLNGF